jgi:hypothetical protein
MTHAVFLAFQELVLCSSGKFLFVWNVLNFLEGVCTIEVVGLNFTCSGLHLGPPKQWESCTCVVVGKSSPFYLLNFGSSSCFLLG